MQFINGKPSKLYVKTSPYWVPTLILVTVLLNQILPSIERLKRRFEVRLSDLFQSQKTDIGFTTITVENQQETHSNFSNNNEIDDLKLEIIALKAENMKFKSDYKLLEDKL